MTCNDCRWKIERKECPWSFDYEGKEYAEDCTDFRCKVFPETAFKKDDGWQPGDFDKLHGKEKQMDNEIINIQFKGEEMDIILKYQEVSEAVTVQAAILNAISLALDHADD